MAGILFTRPAHDYTTRYISHWNEKLIALAYDKQHTVFDLKDERANKKEFESFLVNKHPSLLLLNGHGDRSTVYGYNNEPLLFNGNARLLQDSIVYALACASGAILGPECVTLGTSAYLGYSDDFIFLYSTAHRTRPAQDPLAVLSAEPSNRIGSTLLKGHSAGEAYARSQETFRKTIHQLITSETSAEASAALRYLVWNMQHQVCLGDQNARINNA